MAKPKWQGEYRWCTKRTMLCSLAFVFEECVGHSVCCLIRRMHELNNHSPPHPRELRIPHTVPLLDVPQKPPLLTQATREYWPYKQMIDLQDCILSPLSYTLSVLPSTMLKLYFFTRKQNGKVTNLCSLLLSSSLPLVLLMCDVLFDSLKSDECEENINNNNK